MFRRSHAVVLVALLAPVVSCTQDVVGQDGPQPVCGNHILEPGEQCDISSPGCVDCIIAPTWTCDQQAQTCTQQPGDGVVGGVAGSSSQRENACDMSGYWAVRETSFARDTIVDSVQTASNWFLYYLVQTGDTFSIQQELDCGIDVTGSATVSYTAGSLDSMLYANRMDPESPYGARQGTAVADPEIDGGCDVSLARWYKVRGTDPSYLPSDFSADASLDDLPALPSIADPVNGNDDADAGGPEGATDPDGDGFLGVAFSVTGLIAGTRDSAQRDWEQYTTLPGAPVVQNALQIVVPGTFDSEESVLHVSDCATGCSLLASGSNPATDLAPYVTFAYIGATAGGSRVSQVVMGTPRANLADDLNTCANVRLLLPHNPDAPQN